MPRGRSFAGVLALVALALAVGGAWWTAQPDDADPPVGRDSDALVRADVAGPPGTDGASPAAAGPHRRRARQLTAAETPREAALEALAAAVVQAARSPDAANVRPMVLPGADPPAPVNWTPADLRLAAHQSTVALLAGDVAPRRTGGASRSARRRSRADAGLAGREGAFAPEDDPPSTIRHGLRADVYDFLEGTVEEVPDLASLPPTLTRIDRAIDFPTDASFALPFDPDTFGVLWRGYVVVDAPGDYEFTAGSDDGVRVTIDGTPVVEHSWLRPYAETGGTIRLEPGRHPIEVAFYENEVFASCRLFWRPPGAAALAVVPADAFEPPDDVAAAEPPVLFSVNPDHGRLGDEVVLGGRGFSLSPAYDRVTFAGVPAEIVSVAPTALRVRVPVGASTGPVVVQVGPISTRPLRFEVEDLLGLYGEYFLVGTELSDHPDPAATAPYFVRLDGPLAFVEDDLWQMPYDPDVFAVRWSGFLYVPAEDEYELTLLSDDGAFVTLDGTRVLDLPGVHPPEETSHTVELTRGFHPIEVRYFENFGLAHLQLSWRRRGEPTRTPIPRGFLFAPDALVVREDPRIAALEPGSGVSGDQVAIHGAGFGTDASVVRVEFPGGAWKRPELVADDLIRVRVPHGAASGELRVHVGVRESAPVQFALAEPIGLRADCFDLGTEEVASAADLPSLLGSRAPDVTRVDTRFRFGRREDWKLPFADRAFAVRWTGTIAVETAQNLLVALQSESAALLRVDGADVVADVEPHTLRESYGAGRLTPGEHRIELWTLHRAGADPRLHVFMSPAGRADHLEVPAPWLRPRPPR
jgi:hypothetical protein